MLGFLCGRLDTTRHRHFAVQLTVALERPFTLELAGEPPRERMAAVIPADVPHRFGSSSGNHFFLLIDPLSRLGLRLDAGGEGRSPGAELPEALVEHMRRAAAEILAAPADESPYERVASFVRQWSAELPERRLDRRVRKAIEACQCSLDKHLSLGKLAGLVHLSESRLTHLFKQQTGVPVRRYLKWLRTLDAIDAIQRSDADLTTVAHEVGFADSAHLARTFKEMFGIPPSAVFKP